MLVMPASMPLHALYMHVIDTVFIAYHVIVLHPHNDYSRSF